MNILLRPLNSSENEDVYQMFQEIPAEEDGFENPAHGLSHEEFRVFCHRRVGYSQGLDLPEGHVPDTWYLLFVDNKLVGLTKLRHYLNDYLLNHGGHIGYGIRPSCRGKGYGKIILREVLQEASILEIDRVLLVIRDYNTASRKVCASNGGNLEKVVPGTVFNECFYWIEL